MEITRIDCISKTLPDLLHPGTHPMVYQRGVSLQTWPQLCLSLVPHSAADHYMSRPDERESVTQMRMGLHYVMPQQSQNSRLMFAMVLLRRPTIFYPVKENYDSSKEEIKVQSCLRKEKEHYA